MPGLSFIADFDNNPTNRGQQILSSLTALRQDQGWETKSLLETPNYFLGLDCYRHYPIASYENAEYRIFFEGRIYGHNSSLVSHKLFRLAAVLFGTPEKPEAMCGEWLLDSDGEFLILIIHKPSNKAWILNDALGRLPVYYDLGEQSIAISREFRFIAALRSELQFDRMGIVQYLLFGYPLGRSTLLNQVQRLPPASLIKLESTDKRIVLTQTFVFNFDSKLHSGCSLKENVSNLISLFNEACTGRARLDTESHNIIGLSGGLDSRSVAACLAANKIPFSAVTRLDTAKTSWTDANVAKVLAKTLGADWSSINAERPSADDFLTLLRLKSGMNPLGMVSRVSFLKTLQRTHGSRITYITGDGGDKVLHDLRPAQPLRTRHDLLQYIMLRNQIFSLDHVARMTGISADDIIDELQSHLSAYPEADFAQKYVHFLLYERAFKWLFEGEDRNRSYFWSVAPFYAIPFFNYAMGCPDGQKKHYRLYRLFLMTLSPSVASINNANWGIPISSSMSVLHLLLKSTVRRFLPAITRTIRSLPNEAMSPVFLDCLAKQLQNCPAIKEYIPGLTTQDVENCGSRSKASVLLTVTSAIEDLCTGQSSLALYSDSILQ